MPNEPEKTELTLEDAATPPRVQEVEGALDDPPAPVGEDARALLEMMAEDSPDDAAKKDNEEKRAKKKEPAAKPEEKAAAPEEPEQEEAEEPEPEQVVEEKEPVNPWKGDKKNLEAYAGFKERESKRQARELAELHKKMDQLLKKEEELDEPLPEEEDPDVASNPFVKALRKDIEKLQAKIDAREQMELQQQKLNEARMAIDTVNQRLAMQEQQDPLFVLAENHLSKVIERRAKRQFADLSDSERRQEVHKYILAEKLKMAASGVDPVEAMGEWAIAEGFDPEAAMALLEKRQRESGKKDKPKAESAVSAEPAEKGKKKDPIDEIVSAKKKAENAGTMAGLAGKPPRRYSADMVAGQSTKEFDYLVGKMVAAGEMKIKPGREYPDLEDLLAGKIQETPD